MLSESDYFWDRLFYFKNAVLPARCWFSGNVFFICSITLFYPLFIRAIYIFLPSLSSCYTLINDPVKELRGSLPISNAAEDVPLSFSLPISAYFLPHTGGWQDRRRDIYTERTHTPLGRGEREKFNFNLVDSALEKSLIC